MANRKRKAVTQSELEDWYVQWFVEEMKKRDWMARHFFLGAVCRLHRGHLATEVQKAFAPDELLTGTSKPSEASDVISLPDRVPETRARVKLVQTKLNDFFNLEQ